MDEDLGELPTGDVLIEGRRIIEVAPSVSSSGARVIDANGTVVVSGLIDTHRHT